MKDTLLKIISEISRKTIADLNEHYNEERYLDSLVMVEIVFAFEERYDISFTDGDLAQLKTIRAIVEIMENKTNEA